MGPGIPDIEVAMKEGYSPAGPTVREMGFDAGIGLLNIKKNIDILNISSEEVKAASDKIADRLYGILKDYGLIE